MRIVPDSEKDMGQIGWFERVRMPLVEESRVAFQEFSGDPFGFFGFGSTDARFRCGSFCFHKIESNVLFSTSLFFCL